VAKKKKDKDKDPIRELLAELPPALFLGNPTGTVAIMQDKIVDAGGDPDEVEAWVKACGGYRDRSFAVNARAMTRRPKAPSLPYFVVPEDALK
jgi:hypothetical protein